MSESGHWLNAARSILFVPATRPDRFEKARASGADAICIDLEDAVAADAKDDARSSLMAWLIDDPGAGVPVTVRVNAPASEHGPADLEALAAIAREVAGEIALPDIMVPKVTSAADVNRVAEALGGVSIIALLEDRSGVRNAESIARAAEALAFGAIDYAASLGAAFDHPWLDMARAELRGAAAERNVACFDAPWPEVGDAEGLSERAERAARFGYTGMLAIHPGQIEAINTAFTPSAKDIERARAICAAASASTGVVVLDGRMIDAPVVSQAQQVLVRARRLGLADTDRSLT